MTITTSEMKPILVLGGTGKTGHRVVERLTARGMPTRMGSRSADPPFDWEDQATWTPALQGTRAAYVSYFPDLAIPGASEAVGRSPTSRSTRASGGWCCCRVGARRRPNAPSGPCRDRVPT